MPNEIKVKKYDRADVEAKLSELEFWPHISADERRTLLDHTHHKHYAKGTLVHSNTDLCEGIINVAAGVLRTSMLSEDGREVTLYRIRPGETCILSASCVLREISFDVEIVAEEPSDVFLTDASTFRALAENNVYIRCFGYRLLTERFSDVMWTMQQVLFMGVDRRLALYLKSETLRLGKDEVAATQAGIATSIGSAREVISRMLGYFADEGLVKVGRGKVRILDKERLFDLADYGAESSRG